MNSGKYHEMRKWILGAVATGMIVPSVTAFGQTKISLFVNPKNPSRKSIPVQTTEPPRLLAVPDGGQSAAPASPQTSQIIPVAGEKSEVQKQLEAMYEQDGREAPTFNLQPLAPINGQPQQNTQPQQNAQPQKANPAPVPSQVRTGQSNPSNVPKPVRPAQSYTQYKPRTQAAPYPPQPVPTQPKNFSAAIDAQMQPQANTQAPPQYLPQAQQHRGPLSSLYRRITGANKYAGSQAPVPPDVHETSAAAPQVAGSTAPPAMPIAAKYSVSPKSTVQPVRPQTQAMPQTQPMLATSPVPIQSSGQVQIIAGTNLMPAELPPPLLTMPVLAEAPQPLGRSSEQTSLPPLMTEPQNAALALKSVPESANTGAPAAELAADFPDPFPELPESEADKNITKRPKNSATALEVPVVVKETQRVDVETSPESTAKTDDDPFAVKNKDFSEPSIDERIAPGTVIIATPLPKSQVPQLAPPPLETPNSAGLSSALPRLESPPASAAAPEISMPQPFDPPSKVDPNPSSQLMPPATAPTLAPGAISPPETTVDPQVEKMKRIRERFGMKGLKGFCPVTLHDERELTDARPEFHFTYRSQKFHFATAEAREKFEANPSKYAPAAYGADVVALCRDKDVVEGTLDFAAWFKGRLYLFGSQANYDVFIASPSKYATLAEIE